MIGTCWGKGRVFECLSRRGVCMGKLEHSIGHRGTTMGGAVLPQTPL